MKYCVDCKHYYYGKCYVPAGDVSPVTGIKGYRGDSCDKMRSAGECGPDASLFEERVPRWFLDLFYGTILALLVVGIVLTASYF